MLFSENAVFVLMPSLILLAGHTGAMMDHTAVVRPLPTYSDVFLVFAVVDTLSS